MRNQIARVVLGVCLLGASASAQAPAIRSQLAEQDQHGWSEPRSQAGSSTGSSSSEGGLDGFETWRPLRDSLPSLQQDAEDYTLTNLFRQAHGEFMDRRERYDPDLELRMRWLPNQRVNGEPGSFDLLQYDFDVEAPVVISTEAYLLFGLYQYGRHYKTTSPFGSGGTNPNANAEANFGDETLTAAGARFGLGLFLHDNVLLEVETSPGVYSDLENGLTHKDFDWPSSALFTVRTLDNFFFKAGVRYNQIYRDAPWLPYLGFSWEVTEGLRIDVLAPEYMEVSWWPAASTSFAFGAMVQGAQYHVHSLAASTGKQSADLQVQEVIAYLGMTHRFNDYLSLSARSGIVLAGDYKLTTGAAAYDPADGALDQGFYADITFGIDW